MTLEELKELITSNIKPNNNREITGQVLQDTLVQMADTLGTAPGSFKGVATKNTFPDPISTAMGDIYLAVVDSGEEYEEFTGFGLTVHRGLTMLTYDGSEWKPISLVQVQNTEITDVGDYEFIPTVDAVYRYVQKELNKISNTVKHVKPLFVFDGYYLDAETGNAVSASLPSGISCTDFLPWPNGISRYYFKMPKWPAEVSVPVGNVAAVAYYREDKTFIKRVYLEYYEENISGEDIPTDTAFVRFCTADKESSELQLYVTDENTYDDYDYPLDMWLLHEIGGSKSAQPQDYEVINPIFTLSGYYIGTKGAMEDGRYLTIPFKGASTELITVPDNLEVIDYITPDDEWAGSDFPRDESLSVAFYDENESFISGAEPGVNIPAPKNAKFMRLCTAKLTEPLKLTLRGEDSTYPAKSWALKGFANPYKVLQYRKLGRLPDSEAEIARKNMTVNVPIFRLTEESDNIVLGTFDFTEQRAAQELLLYNQVDHNNAHPGSLLIAKTKELGFEATNNIGVYVYIGPGGIVGSGLEDFKSDGSGNWKLLVTKEMLDAKAGNTSLENFRLMVMQANDMGDGTYGLGETAAPEIFIPGSDNVPEGTEFYLWRKTSKSRKMDISIAKAGESVYRRPYFAPVFADPLDWGSGGPDIYRSNPVKLVAVKIPIMGDVGNGHQQAQINANGRGLMVLVTKEDYVWKDIHGGVKVKIPMGSSLGTLLKMRFLREYMKLETSSLVGEPMAFSGGGGFLYPGQSYLYHKKERHFAISTSLENPVLLKFRMYMMVIPTPSKTLSGMIVEKIHSGMLSRNEGDTYQIVLRAEAL